jgi:hypothetical protein
MEKINAIDLERKCTNMSQRCRENMYKMDKAHWMNNNETKTFDDLRCNTPE